MLQRISDHILDRAVKHLRAPIHRAGRLALPDHRAPRRLRFEVGIVDDLAHQFLHVHLLFRSRQFAGFEPGQLEQIADQPIDAHDLLLDAFERRFTAAVLQADEADGSLQPREGRTHFVGHVVQQAALPIHRYLQAVSYTHLPPLQ